MQYTKPLTESDLAQQSQVEALDTLECVSDAEALSDAESMVVLATADGDEQYLAYTQLVLDFLRYYTRRRHRDDDEAHVDEAWEGGVWICYVTEDGDVYTRADFERLVAEFSPQHGLPSEGKAQRLY